MKENVIIGKLIPAGTGMKRYRNVHLSTDVEETEEIILEEEEIIPVETEGFDEMEDAEEVLDFAEDEI